MAEETPAIGDFTVIWRPRQEDNFRVDHVTCECSDGSTVVAAAADIYVAEFDGDPDDLEYTLRNYEFVAIFDGHLVESNFA